MPTELGRSQVEVQSCPLGSEGPWLRHSGAHSDRKPAVEVLQCPLRVEVDADMVEEKLEEEEEEEAEEEEAEEEEAAEKEEEDEENSSDKI